LTQTGVKGKVLSSCYLCNPGEYAVRDPSVPNQVNSSYSEYIPLNCTRCPIGTYSDSSTTVGGCTKCPGDTKTVGAGSTNIQACGCPYPQVMSQDNKTCVGCLENEYRYNNQSCRKCPLWSRGGMGASKMEDCRCEPGYNPIIPKLGRPGIMYQEGCIQCPRGTYSSSMSNSPCLPCTNGGTTAYTGSKSASDCNLCSKNYCLVYEGARTVCKYYAAIPKARLSSSGECILA
jgi:hypothetical protein